MNKQELINELTKYVERYEDATDEYYQGKSSAYEVALKLAKKLGLDEPQKPVVPKVVGEYLNHCMANEWTLREAFLTGKIRLPEYLHKAVDWLNDSMNQNIFAQAWLFGYEVEKEPLYYVYLPKIIVLPEMMVPDIEGAYLMKSDDEIELADNNRFDEMKFTEREIKAIDERYWAFAVPVEEVAEG